ncbi:MAG: Ham1 family [Candidatus Parcubacteria bacterium]|jgi:inosine/xanthosine triphosphate pyrophosphatase family protein
MKIILSTQNPGKALQIQTLLNDGRFEVVSLGSLGITDEVWAEMSPEEQNSISHRGQAFRKVREVLTQKFF